MSDITLVTGRVHEFVVGGLVSEFTCGVAAGELDIGEVAVYITQDNELDMVKSEMAKLGYNLEHVTSDFLKNPEVLRALKVRSFTGEEFVLITLMNLVGLVTIENIVKELRDHDINIGLLGINAVRWPVQVLMDAQVDLLEGLDVPTLIGMSDPIPGQVSPLLKRFDDIQTIVGNPF